MAKCLAQWLSLSLVLGTATATKAQEQPCVQARQQGVENAVEICDQVLSEAVNDKDFDAERRARFQLAILARHEDRLSDASQQLQAIAGSPGFAEDWQTQYRWTRERGILAHYRGESAAALSAFRSALAIAQDQEDPALLARSYNDLGNAYRQLGAHAKALDAFMQALDIKRQNGDSQLGSTLNNIANLLGQLDEYGRADDFYAQALAEHERHGDMAHLAHTRENRAALAAEHGDIDTARRGLEMAFEEFASLNRPVDQLRVAAARARLALDKDRTQMAADWLARAAQLADTNELQLPADWHLQRAALLRQQGVPQAALSSLRDIEASLAIWPTAQRLAAHRALADLHGELKNPAAALAQERQWSAMKLAQQARLHDEALNSKRVLFDVAEKQRDIERLQDENRLQAANLARQRARTGLLIAVGLLIAALVIGGLIAVQYRRNRRTELERQALQSRVRHYRTAAESLRTSQQQLQELLDTSHEAMLAIDANNQIVFANQAAERRLGLNDALLGQSVESVFSQDAMSVLSEPGSDLAARARNGQELRLNIGLLDLEEEIRVIHVQGPGKTPPGMQQLLTRINRHYERVQEFSVALQASLKSEEGPNQDLDEKWQLVDRELADLSERLGNVQNSTRAQFRESLVALMCDSVDAYAEHADGDRIDLAEQSGIWRVTIDEGRLRTRAMDRYMQLDKLPKQPRWREVVRTAYFVLPLLPEQAAASLQQRVDEVLAQAARLGLR